MPHDHEESARRRQEDEWRDALARESKSRQELVVVEGILRTIAAAPIGSNSQRMAQDGIEALNRMRKR